MPCAGLEIKTVARAGGIILGLATVVVGIAQLATDASGVKEVVNAIYQIIFGTMALIVEARKLHWLGKLAFLRSYTGLGVFQVFIAGLVLGSEWWQYILAIALAGVAVVNLGGGILAKWEMDGLDGGAAAPAGKPVSQLNNVVANPVAPPPPPPPHAGGGTGGLDSDWPNQ